MKHITDYNDFIVEIKNEKLNEGLFDSLTSIFSKISSMFKDTGKLGSQMDLAIAKAGATDDKMNVKSIKVGASVLLRLVDPADDKNKSILSITKLADIPDGSGLFQLSGSDNIDFIKNLGFATIEDLAKTGVILILSPDSLSKDKPLTMRIYKNTNKGVPVVTKTLIKSILPAETVAKEVPES